MTNLKAWFRSGSPWVWMNAGAVTASIVMVSALIILIAVRGLGHFWAKPIFEAEYVEADGSISRLIGEIHDSEWMRPADALRRRNELEIELAPPTIVTLSELCGQSSVSRAMQAARDREPEVFELSLDLSQRGLAEAPDLEQFGIGHDDQLPDGFQLRAFEAVV